MAYMKDGSRVTPWSLAKTLMGLAMKGYREVPGYTVAERESTGEIYLAIQLSPPENRA